jgi:hypothetical protein
MESRSKLFARSFRAGSKSARFGRQSPLASGPGIAIHPCEPTTGVHEAECQRRTREGVPTTSTEIPPTRHPDHRHTCERTLPAGGPETATSAIGGQPATALRRSFLRRASINAARWGQTTEARRKCCRPNRCSTRASVHGFQRRTTTVHTASARRRHS